MEKTHRAGHGEGAWSIMLSLSPHVPHLHMFPKLETLQTFSLWVSVAASWHRWLIMSLAIGDWFYLWGKGWRVPPPPHPPFVPLATSTNLGCFPKSSHQHKSSHGLRGLVMNHKTFLSHLRLCSWGLETKGLGICEPRAVHKDQLYMKSIYLFIWMTKHVYFSYTVNILSHHFTHLCVPNSSTGGMVLCATALDKYPLNE